MSNSAESQVTVFPLCNVEIQQHTDINIPANFAKKWCPLGNLKAKKKKDNLKAKNLNRKLNVQLATTKLNLLF